MSTIRQHRFFGHFPRPLRPALLRPRANARQHHAATPNHRIAASIARLGDGPAEQIVDSVLLLPAVRDCRASILRLALRLQWYTHIWVCGFPFGQPGGAQGADAEQTCALSRAISVSNFVIRTRASALVDGWLWRNCSKLNAESSASSEPAKYGQVSRRPLSRRRAPERQGNQSNAR